MIIEVKVIHTGEGTEALLFVDGAPHGTAWNTTGGDFSFRTVVDTDD